MRSSVSMTTKFPVSALRTALRSRVVILLVLLVGLIVPCADAQPVVYSSPTLVGYTSATASNQAGLSQAGLAQAGRIAANQRGDIFWINNPFGSQSPNSLVEVPFGGTTQVLLVANLQAVSFSVTVDASNNLWVQDNTNGLLFIPFANGGYASGLDLSTTTPPTCALPVKSTTNSLPCLLPASFISAPLLGYYAALSDIQVDTSGNIYAVDFYDGSDSGSVNRLIEYNATTGTPTILVDGLPTVNVYGAGQLAVTAGGDLYYVDGSNLYHSTAGSGTASILSGFSNPTGVTIDGKGNLYVTDTGNNRIVVVPNISGTLNFAGLYPVYTTNATAGTPYGDVGVDGFGDVTFAGGQYTGTIYTEVAQQQQHVAYSKPVLAGVASSVATISGGLNLDGKATVGRIAANQRGDIFWPNNPFGSQSPNSLVEVPFGSSTQILLVANLPAVSFSVTVDPSNNLWVQDNTNGLLFIPFVHGGYASGLDLSVTTPPTCALPVKSTTNSLPCLLPAGFVNAPLLGYYAALSDIQVDTSGNIYAVDFYDGSDSGSVNRLIEYNATTGTPTILVDGLPAVSVYGAGQLAVTAGGDLYYVDGSNLYHSTAGSGTASILSGFSNPTGVTIDGKGNLYVTDTGNSRIAVVPNVSGTLNFAGLYSIYTADATAGTPYDSVGVDGFGNVTFAGGQYSGTFYTLFTNPQISSVAISPAVVTVPIGGTVQFNPVVAGVGDKSVSWTVASSTGLSPGTITSTGLYTTPYPAPASVTVTATSNQDPTKSASAVVALSTPAPAIGPVLTVDLATQTHPISPLIYGMNSYPQIYGTNHSGYNLYASGVAKSIALPIDRWNSPTYNYKYDSDNVAFCCYFLNSVGDTNDISDNNGGLVNTLIAQDEQTGTKTMINVPILGWTSQGDTTKCSFSVAKYGPQQMTDPYAPNTDCGNGIEPDGKTKIINDPNDALFPADENFVSGWVNNLTGKFGTAANGGVAIYELDNEPDIWDVTAYNEQPNLMTYDLLTNNSLSYAAAIKAADPTAQVSGPVISTWANFFYSKQDYLNGLASSGKCYNCNPTDRIAHGNIPLIEYYLQQFQQASAQAGTRLLDYLDLHTYFAADNLSLNNAPGDTGAQQARLNSTRVMWDPTYTDPNFTDPNNRTASAPPIPVQLIPTMRNWVARDYPGTKLAITEYNWGGFDGITGALAQADLFGIFGREGLDLATVWNPPNPSSPEAPGLNAFKAFRNYDGAGSQFGNIAISSSSANQGQLAVYGALRTTDNALTLVVINKTYGDLTSTLYCPNLTATGPAQAFLYSNAHLAGIVALPNVTMTPLNSEVPSSSLTTTFPAQSITVLVVPTE